MPGRTSRMAIALVAMAGLFLSLYLTLYKLGLIGTLACGSGECETVQLSRWGDFLGLPVAAWGVLFYIGVLALALLGLAERWEAAPRVSISLVGLTLWGVAFSAWLTWLELYVIHAICRWCVVSALLTVLLFGLSVWDLRSLTRARAQAE